MKVALCTPSLSRVSGANSFQLHLAAQLRAFGHEVSLWTLAQTRESKVLAIKRTGERVPDGTRMEMGKDILSWPELHERVDVVHITNAGQVYLGFEELLDKNLGPTVLTVHDPYEMLVNQREGRFIRLIDTVDRVHFIGANYFAHFRECNYIPPEEFDRKAMWARQPYVAMTPVSSMPNHAITCTSNWRWNKGIVPIVKAAEILAETDEELDLQFWTTDRMDDVYEQVRKRTGWKNCSVHGEGHDPSEFLYAAYSARILLDMVFFDEYDTGRTEYPILEAWNFGVTPIINEKFAGKAPTDYTPGHDVYVTEPTAEGIALAVRYARGRPLLERDMLLRLSEHNTAASGAIIAGVYEELVSA